MKKLSAILIVITLMLFSKNNAYAVVSTASDIPIKSATPIKNSLNVSTKSATSASEKQALRVEKKAEKEASVSANLKERANKEIGRRITSLNNILTKISGLKRLSSTQKSSLSTQVQTEITNLTNLKTKINEDTDATTLKTDVKSIVLSYRVYALFIPKIQILTASEGIMNTTDKLTEISNKLQTEIQTAKTNGKDVTTVTNSLTDLQSKIQTANKNAENAQNLVLPLNPEGFPENKGTLQAARNLLVSAKQDLAVARKDAKEITQILKANLRSKNATTSSTLKP